MVFPSAALTSPRTLLSSFSLVPRVYPPIMQAKALKYTLFGTCFLRLGLRNVVVLIEPLAIMLSIFVFSAVEVRPPYHG